MEEFNIGFVSSKYKYMILYYKSTFSNKKIIKGIPLTEEEWKGILYYLYETEDAKNLESKLVEIIRRKNFERQNFDFNSYFQLSKKSRAEINNPIKEDLDILYKDFISVILDYQIKCRANYLKNLTQMTMGFLMKMSLFSLLQILICSMKALVNIQIDCSVFVVTFFSKEILKELDLNGNLKKVNLLDKISTKEYVISKSDVV